MCVGACVRAACRHLSPLSFPRITIICTCMLFLSRSLSESPPLSLSDLGQIPTNVYIIFRFIPVVKMFFPPKDESDELLTLSL